MEQRDATTVAEHHGLGDVAVATSRLPAKYGHHASKRTAPSFSVRLRGLTRTRPNRRSGSGRRSRMMTNQRIGSAPTRPVATACYESPEYFGRPARFARYRPLARQLLLPLSVQPSVPRPCGWRGGVLVCSPHLGPSRPSQSGDRWRRVGSADRGRRMPATGRAGATTLRTVSSVLRFFVNCLNSRRGPSCHVTPRCRSCVRSSPIRGPRGEGPEAGTTRTRHSASAILRATG